MPRPTPVRANVARSQRALYTRGPSCRAPLTRSISAPPPRANFAPRMHHSTEPVRLSDEYTYFADRIEKRARWERIRNWVVFGGSAALGSAVAEATIVLSGLAPPDTIGAGLAFGGIALGSAGLQWALIKIQGVGSIPTSMGGRLANPADPKEKAFYDTVHELAKTANLPQPPAVYIIPTEEMNAFAAGTRPGAQVTAATTALLRECTHEEIRAVMAHEIGHLRNGDGKTSLQMIAMNAGFFAVLRLGLRMLQFSNDSRGRSENDKKDIRKPLGIALTVLGLFFVAFGTLFQAKTSRRREFDADASCVAFTRDNAALASALRKISRVKPSALASSPLHTEGNHQLYGHMYFSDVTSAKPKTGLMDRVKALLATHPPVEERIAKLNSYTAAALQMQKRAEQTTKHIGPGVASRSVGGSTKSRERIN